MSTSIADLVVNISTNIASLNDGMTKAVSAIEQATTRMTATFGTVDGAIGAITSSLENFAKIAGVSLGVGAFAGLIGSAIDGQAELARLSERTGATVESLSAMRTAAKYAGVDMDSVATALARFTVNITAAQSGTGKQAAALTALGFNAKTFATQYATTDEAILAVAQAMNQYGIGIGKTAIQQDLLGRSGASLAVFYKELAERGLDGVKVTTAQAQAAKALEDSITKLKLSFSGMVSTLATNLVPVLQAVVNGIDTFKTIAEGALVAFVAWPIAVTVIGRAVEVLVLYRTAALEAAAANAVLGTSLTASFDFSFFTNLLKLPAAFTSGWAAALGGVGALIFAAFAGWKFGDWLQENFFEAKVAGAYFVDWMLTAWENIKFAGQVAWEFIKASFLGAFTFMQNALGTFYETISKGLSFVGLDDLSATVATFAKGIMSTSDPMKDMTTNITKLEIANTAAKNSIHAITDDMKIYAVQTALISKESSDAAKGPAPIPAATSKAAKDAIEGLNAYYKALTDVAKASTDSVAKVQLQAIENGQSDLKRQYDQGILSFQQFYDAQTALQKTALGVQEGQLKDDVDAQAKLVDSLQSVYIQFTTSAKQQALPIGEQLNTAAKAAAPLLEAFAKLQTAQGALNVVQLKGAEIGKDYVAQLISANSSILATVRSLETQISNQQLANDAIGLTASQYQLLLAAKDRDLAADLAAHGASQAVLDDLANQIAAREKLAASIAQGEGLQRLNQAWTDTFKSLADAGANFIQDFVQHGTSAFKNLWDDFKTFALKTLAEIAAQKIVVQIAASIGLGGTASNALAGSNPLGSILGGGNPLSGIGSLFGNIGTAFTNAFDTIGGIFGAGVDTFAAATETYAAGAAALSTTATGVLGALGPIGAAVGLAYTVANLLGAFSHGGPKTGGSAAGGIDLSTGSALDGSGLDRYFTPNQADATVKQIVDSVTQTYQQVAKQIGLTSGSALFNFGFDTDPQGTANSRVSGGAVVNGQQVFNQRDVDVGRDDSAVQTGLALEAQRALLAALQSSDLPAYLASIFNSADAATATPDQINNIIATAEALKTAVDVVSSLGDQFAGLDPDAITSLLTAFGGLQNFTTAFQYLGANFTTTADKLQTNTALLNNSFAALGLQVPKNHADFVSLLTSLATADPASQALAASVAGLEPLFIAVAGTADQAAAALQAQAAANQKVIDSATSFLQSNFYNTAEAQAQKLASDTAAVAVAAAQLGVAIPTTLDGFRDLVTGIDQSTAAGQALYASLIVLAPAVYDIATAAGAAASAVSTAADAITQSAQQITDRSGTVGDPQSIEQSVQAFFSSIATIAGNIPNADFGTQLGLQINLITDKIADFQAKAAIFAAAGNFDYATNINAQVKTLQAQNAKFADELGRYTTLTAQYGAATAKQLVDLQDSYAQQAQALSQNVGGLPDNSTALDALKSVFDQQWAAIIAGTSAGVTGTIDQLQKLRDSLATYVQGLLVGNLSPLTPTQKYGQALTDFQNEFAKALGGDQGALGDISKFSDTLLSLGRDQFASGQKYTDLFNLVTGDLGLLTQPTISKGDPLSAALPVNGTIASSDDIAGLKTAVVAALTDTQAAVANANSADIKDLKQQVEQLQSTLVDALASNRNR